MYIKNTTAAMNNIHFNPVNVIELTKLTIAAPIPMTEATTKTIGMSIAMIIHASKNFKNDFIIFSKY